MFSFTFVFAMKKKKYKAKDKAGKAMEPQVEYGTGNRTIHFFSSFDDMAEHEAKLRAALSHDERMANAELLRRNVFNEHLSANGKWKPIAKVFKIMPPYVS